ncbi:ATP-binding protein [bacterium D16-51]|nr:ATP-binding protein [bacterium D16-59]RKI59135.1 ATP-binding protein [bacterium D16-51]
MKLFDFLFGKTIDRRIAAYQNDLIRKHCNEVENMYRQVRGWRHDYHNHIQTMLALVDKPEQMRSYLLTLNKDLTTVDTVIKTGNVMLDAVLNSKLSLIKTKNITVNAKAVVPANLSISDVDLCVIIGNLLDNAMEACEKQKEISERFIRIFIGVLKKQLYISVMNSAGGELKKEGGRYVSTKNFGGHGFGLMRVDRITEKNNGYVNRQNEPGVFATEVMLPL